jgi:hypothetical protein
MTPAHHEWLHPTTNTEWALLRTLAANDLKALGLRCWNEPDAGAVPFSGKQLMLLPAEWYAHIPLDYKLVDINGRETRFNQNTHGNDQRRGYLAYGILV